MTQILTHPNNFPEIRSRFCWLDEARPTSRTNARFRLRFHIDGAPESFRILASADTRYALWVNSIPVGRGPLKGTPNRYRTETYQLAPYLQSGHNLIAVEVRWLGEGESESYNHTPQPGLFVQGIDSPILDTPGNWKAACDHSTKPNWEDPYKEAFPWLGPLDKVKGAPNSKNWLQPEFDDNTWATASAVGPTPSRCGYGVVPQRNLVPSETLHPVEEKKSFVRFLEKRKPLSLPWKLEAGQGGELWLDAGSLTTSYPVLNFISIAKRKARIVYAEALGKWNGDQWEKGEQRNQVEDQEPHGYSDELEIPEGYFTFEPFHWRTFWYIKIIVEPGPHALSLHSAAHKFTTYNQSINASFSCSEPEIEKLWETSIRTLQLCAHETYEDCPYFEQLNYVGDTRLQALCSFYLANEASLAKRSIALFRDSLSPEGLVASREPSAQRQDIPIFSLHWILMLHDYWRWNGDEEWDFVNSCLPAVQAIIGYFERRITQNGFVGQIDAWEWTDWVPQWNRGIAPAVKAGTGSTYLTGFLSMAVEAAIELTFRANASHLTSHYQTLLNRLRESIRAQAWCPTQSAFIEGPARADDPLTQHSQIAAILGKAATNEQLNALKTRILNTREFVPVSLFQRFYLVRCLKKLNAFENFFSDTLKPWRGFVEKGFSTWPETEGETRSDCHAWGSWMIIEFFESILGASAAAPGWKRILINPEYSACRFASGSFEAPCGTIAISWIDPNKENFKFRAEVPENVPTTITLPNGNRRDFPSGGHIELEANVIKRPTCQSEVHPPS